MFNKGDNKAWQCMQIGYYCAALVCFHALSPAFLYDILQSSEDLFPAPASTMRPYITACLRGVLAAMADGQIQGHTSIAHADVKAAAAAACTCIPTISAGRTHFLTAADQVCTLCDG